MAPVISLVHDDNLCGGYKSVPIRNLWSAGLTIDYKIVVIVLRNCCLVVARVGLYKSRLRHQVAVKERGGGLRDIE